MNNDRSNILALGLLASILSGGEQLFRPGKRDNPSPSETSDDRKVEALRTQRGPDQTGVKVDPTPADGAGIPAAADLGPSPLAGIRPIEPARVPAIQHAYDLVGSIAREGMEGANFTIEFNDKRYFVSANVESP